jgi:hypothetical protein
LFYQRLAPKINKYSHAIEKDRIFTERRQIEIMKKYCKEKRQRG